jgi:hypothetical protein
MQLKYESKVLCYSFFEGLLHFIITIIDEFYVVHPLTFISAKKEKKGVEFFNIRHV